MENKQKKYKDQFLRDLCARLPYKTKCCNRNTEEDFVLCDATDTDSNTPSFDYGFGVIEFVQPYLRPVSSLTEEEMDKLFDILHIDKEGKDDDWIKINDATGIKFFLTTGRWMEEMDEALAYLRSIHIDIYDFIGKGLALEAPEGLYKI